MPNEPSSRNVIIAFVIVIIAIVIGIVVLLSTRPDPVEIVVNPPMPTATAEPSATPEPIQVYVSGAINGEAQVIELPVESRIQDALDTVGGVSDDADLERVNLAGILRDGDHVYVFAIGETAETVIPTPSGGGLVNVNTATLEELDSLPGIGPSTAQAIIDYREEFGTFTSLEDLDEVSGIGPSTLEQLADLIEF